MSRVDVSISVGGGGGYWVGPWRHQQQLEHLDRHPSPHRPLYDHDEHFWRVIRVIQLSLKDEKNGLKRCVREDEGDKGMEGEGAIRCVDGMCR